MIDSPKEYTIKGCLRAFKESGEYTNLIVENIEEENPKYRYLWLTIPPNWSDVKLKLDEVMFFNFIVAEGGNNIMMQMRDVLRFITLQQTGIKSQFH